MISETIVNNFNITWYYMLQSLTNYSFERQRTATDIFQGLDNILNFQRVRRPFIITAT